MARLLVVHHTPSPAMQEMLEATLAGARDDAIEGVEVVVRPALSASVVDVLSADGYLLGTPANIGYMSGALKHFFDTIYYPCLDATKGRPFAAYVHGNLGVEAAVTAIESITTGLGWRAASQILTVTGAPTRADRDALTDLGGTIAATLMPQ
jgi:multimeric flavodoxin WrbA